MLNQCVMDSVMHGLDPCIHVFQARKPCEGKTWMAVTSTAMTILRVCNVLILLNSFRARHLERENERARKLVEDAFLR